ncbi:hypothetical protein BJV82DRAFT_713562 [Fennellomyces sp. T-0311]|nr:hypothetical protein BJV82DRAFT_713562 [Fennellomyces sp. T-0311]
MSTSRWYRHSHTTLPPVTITLTDIVYSTTNEIPTITTTPTIQDLNSSDGWSHHLHQLLPVLGVFAVIGMLTVLALLGYLGFRFYRSGQRRLDQDDHDDDDDHEPMQFENSASELKALYAPPIRYTEKKRLDSPIENSEQPISSTFIPINTSPLTLVPRMEVWQDPQRRQGVDEIDLWERKQLKQQEESPRSSSETQQSMATAFGK